MADPEAVVPYYDPYESPLNHNILNFANDQNPTLADLSQPTLQGPFPYTSSLPEINETTPGDNHPFSDPMVHGAFQSNNGGGSTEAGPSNVHAESSHQGQENFGSQNFGEDGIPLSIWPEPPIPFFCSCCQVLRQLVHTNGSIIAKIEIHGRLGMICHAILEERNVNVSSSNHHQIKMFDFCGKSLEDIKYFLMQYCLRQNLAGFAMMEDPLSSYYETLCIGLDWDDDLNDFHQFSPNNSGEASEMEQEAEAENGEERPRVNLSVQVIVTLVFVLEASTRVSLAEFGIVFVIFSSLHDILVILCRGKELYG
ncbi:RWP-RK domain containing protein [Quillaja saponaria]|uniref:RWP-RK domain containing protein n=1 Tax=Quillaja saponaria TaxID=32244 RepID=A0AAD7LJC6_QUISA|nr:RWP-RK domain containing protein [Quillaja saponaria]